MFPVYQRFYLASYKGHGDDLKERIEDTLIRFFTRGKYSHTEIVAIPAGIEYNELPFGTDVDIYSSSPRDNGVRVKTVRLKSKNWDLLPIHCDIKSFNERLNQYFEDTQYSKYDIRGAIGLITGANQKDNKFFCSEWCYNVIFNSNFGWRFCPNALHQLIKDINRNK